MTPSIQHLTEPASRTVLIVEDEVLIRFMAAEMLQDAGFRVIEACSGDEAVAVLDSNVLCDVVFTDVNMPGSIDGIGLASYVKQAHPTIPVILTSGGVPHHVLSQAAPAAIISKPYGEADLAKAIEQALSVTHG